MSEMRVYIAAPFAARDGLFVFAEELASIGMTCVSGWLNSPGTVAEGVGTAEALTDEQVRRECWRDLNAVKNADAVVQFSGLAVEALRIPEANGPLLHTGGRHVELGHALAYDVPVIVIGPAENIFQRALCTVVGDWHAAVLALVALDRARVVVGSEASA